jgi:hypothetical protein
VWTQDTVSTEQLGLWWTQGMAVTLLVSRTSVAVCVGACLPATQCKGTRDLLRDQSEGAEGWTSCSQP